MRALIAGDLADASLAGLSADRRFATAYNAALQAANMAIACAGYRIVSKVGHHRVSLESTKLALGKAAHKYADHFETCRRKRNTIDCTFSNVATNTEAKEIVVQAKTVLRRSRRLNYEEPPRAENVRVETSLNRRRGLSPVVGAHTTPPTSSFLANFRSADKPPGNHLGPRPRSQMDYCDDL
jgi:hypothetical protein